MPSIDIRMFGDKELEKKLGRLADKKQISVVRSALRKEAKKSKDRIVSNISRLGLIDSGRMQAGYYSAKIKSTRSRSLIRIGVENPGREFLGIPPGSKFYYPYAVEFGHPGAKPMPFIRPAIDEHRNKSFHDIGSDIGKGIVRAAKKK